MTGAERLERVREALRYWRLDPKNLAALDGCVLLTAEEAERLREGFELWREGTPRRIEGRGTVVLADEEIGWALALLSPEGSDDDEDDPYPENPGPFGTNPGEC